MINQICTKGTKCIFYEETIEDYEIIQNFGKGEIRKKGTEICYYCKNPKKLSYYEERKLMTKAPKQCKLKTTTLITEFNNKTVPISDFC